MGDKPDQDLPKAVAWAEDQELTIPRVAEFLEIGKEQIRKGQVHVHRSTVSKQVPVNMKLLQRKADIEIIPIGKFVNEVPQVRQENGATIIPVYEERVEGIKKIYLKEEVKISTQETESDFQEEVEVKEHVININHEN